MMRNLDRRVELLFPIEDDEIKKEVKRILDTILKDTHKARVLNPDGSYKKLDKRRKKFIDSQQVLYDFAIEQIEKGKFERQEWQKVKFRPIMTLRETEG